MAEGKMLHTTKMIQSSIFDSFVKLESNVENLRIDAGITLLRHLYQKQSENEKGITCTEVNYTLKRLIRALGTIKQYKRAGFFSVLVEMLILFPNITVQSVMEIIEKELYPIRNCSKKEITEAYSGQVLVIGALIHSNKLTKESQNTQVEILEKLIAAGQKKNILLAVISSFLIDYMHKIDEVHFKTVLWPLLKNEIIKPWEEHTLDSFYLLLEARKQFPNVVKSKILLKHLGNEEIVNKKSILKCAKLLMNLPVLFVANHPVYGEVCQQICTLDIAASFWELLVKENELQPTQYKEQMLLNFLDCLLQHSNVEMIPDFLCEGFMELIVKTLQTKKIKTSSAHKANELFTKMSTLLANDNVKDEVKINFIKRILFYPGNLMFDKMAGTKIVTQLSSHMKMEAVKKISKMLRDVISAQKPKVKNSLGETCLWSKWERSYAAQLFIRLLSLPLIQENTKWKVKQLKFLVTIGLIASKPCDPGDTVNIAVSKEVRNCIFKVLDQKVNKVDQLIILLTSVVHYLHEILFIEEDPVKLYQPLSETSAAAWQKMVALVNEIESEQDDSVPNIQSGRKMFHVLFLHMGLQLHHNAALAEEALEELHCCYERTKNAFEKNEKNNAKSTGEDEPYWVEVIVDLLLSLLSHTSHLQRNIVGVIFPHLCPYLTPASVHQIIQVLDPHGKQPLSSTDTEGDDESDREDGNEDSCSKESIEAQSASGDDNNDDDDDDDDDDYDDSDNEPVDAHLKLAVQTALKKAGGGYSGSDEESIDMDQMTKEQRNGLDAALSEAFKLRKHNQAHHKRKKQSKDDETLMHFRVRVLDLLDMYIANQPALALLLDIILPLFELLEFCIKDDHQKPLEMRVRYCLKKLSNVKHFSSTDGVDQKLLSVVLHRLLQKGERAVAVYQNMSLPLVQCATFLARTSYHLGVHADSSPSMHTPVLEVYKEALATFFKQRDSLLPPDVFKSVLVLTWGGAWKLADNILDYAFDLAIRPYRRYQALELLAVFFSNGRLIVDASPKLIKKLHKLEKNLSTHIVELLTRIVDEKEKKENNTDVKGKCIKEMFHLLCVVWQVHKRKGCDTPAAIDWEAVKTAVSRYWEVMSLATDTKTALKKLATALEISLSKKEVVTEAKASNGQQSIACQDENREERSGVPENSVEFALSSREDESGSDDSDDTSDDTGDKGYESGNDDKESTQSKTKKRKRPKTDNFKGKALLKKQSKIDRLLAMSEGLNDTFHFAEVDVSKLKELTVESEENVNRKKKRKHLEQVEDSSSISSDEVPKASNKSNFHKSSRKLKINGDKGSDSVPKQKKHKVSE